MSDAGCGFLQECEAKYKEKNILLVSHGDPIVLFLQAAMVFLISKPSRGGLAAEQIIIIQKASVPRSGCPHGSANDTGEIDLHRPFVDQVQLHCPKCKHAMKRTPEVADVCTLDSGAEPDRQRAMQIDLAGIVPRNRADIHFLGPMLFWDNYYLLRRQPTARWLAYQKKPIAACRNTRSDLHDSRVKYFSLLFRFALLEKSHIRRRTSVNDSPSFGRWLITLLPR